MTPQDMTAHIWRLEQMLEKSGATGITLYACVSADGAAIWLHRENSKPVCIKETTWGSMFAKAETIICRIADIDADAEYRSWFGDAIAPDIEQAEAGFGRAA